MDYLKSLSIAITEVIDYIGFERCMKALESEECLQGQRELKEAFRVSLMTNILSSFYKRGKSMHLQKGIDSCQPARIAQADMGRYFLLSLNDFQVKRPVFISSLFRYLDKVDPYFVMPCLV